MNEVVTLNRKEQQALQILGRVDRGEFTAGRAAEMLSLSVRQTRRKLAAYRQVSAQALAHGNRDGYRGVRALRRSGSEW